MSASRASIKRAVLAARILSKSDKSDNDTREAKGLPDHRKDDSKLPTAEAGFRGGSVASKTRIRRQLSRRRSSSGPDSGLLKFPMAGKIREDDKILPGKLSLSRSRSFETDAWPVWSSLAIEFCVH